MHQSRADRSRYGRYPHSYGKRTDKGTRTPALPAHSGQSVGRLQGSETDKPLPIPTVLSYELPTPNVKLMGGVSAMPLIGIHDLLCCSNQQFVIGCFITLYDIKYVFRIFINLCLLDLPNLQATKYIICIVTITVLMRLIWNRLNQVISTLISDAVVEPIEEYVNSKTKLLFGHFGFFHILVSISFRTSCQNVINILYSA